MAYSVNVKVDAEGKCGLVAGGADNAFQLHAQRPLQRCGIEAAVSARPRRDGEPAGSSATASSAYSATMASRFPAWSARR